MGTVISAISYWSSSLLYSHVDTLYTMIAMGIPSMRGVGNARV
jgi:hypothetical protein